MRICGIRGRRAVHLAFGMVALVCLRTSVVATAQEAVTFSGTTVDEQGLALPGASVELRAPDGTFVTSTFSNRRGEFVMTGVRPGDHRVVTILQGFVTDEREVRLQADTSGFDITLAIGGFQQEISVSAVMPEVATEFVVTAREIEKRAVRDVATALRAESGVNAVRRGPINLEPTIRGLFEAQIGMFVDGTRTFAAGPARMDSDISHVSPHMLQAVRVVKGPYALTWGAGALSAIQVETFKPAFSGGQFVVEGQAGFNHGGNGNSNDGYAGLWGRNDRARFTFFHNSRTGDDYVDGEGSVIPGDYESHETRWDVGFRPDPNLVVEYSGGYQKQNDLDYPGRLLNAEFFETESHAFQTDYTPGIGFINEVSGRVYVNRKDHAMTNDDKPSAMAMPGRIPPFGLDVGIGANSDTVGGQFHVGLGEGALSYKVGMDIYRLSQDADRTITNRSTGMVMLTDIVWPEATTTNAGGYAQVVYDLGRARVGGTLRVDHEDISAGAVSAFFRANTTGVLDRTDTSVSAAGNASVRVADAVVVNLGVGRAVRQPTILERYSDRFPATKFQIAAEFMGNPALVAEESLEFNVGTVFRVGRVTFEGDFFYRNIGNYITVAPDPSLAKRLPLSPDPGRFPALDAAVYRYINGDAARFTGYDLKAESALGPHVDIRGGWTYTWAEDTFFAEPIFGIAPFEQRYALHVHTLDRRGWVEVSLTNAAAQERVATTRLERMTEGWTRLDVLAGVEVVDGFSVKLGVENVTNEFYATHVNSLNPFTGQRIAEIGRSFYAGVEFGF